MGIENETSYEKRCTEFSKLQARLGELADEVRQKLSDMAEEFCFDLDTEYELFDIRMRDLLETGKKSHQEDLSHNSREEN